VRVSGDAFPGERLTGSIGSISPHAEEGEIGNSSPSFGIRVIIESVSPELRRRIMVGMTANLEIIIHEKNDALMVPISTVITEQGKRYVMRRKKNDPGGAAEKVEVTTGYTTQDTVEILSGINAGDLI
jgi:multidrug efflux pump subunit AcrA (membrane-fusion protein)